MLAVAAAAMVTLVSAAMALLLLESDLHAADVPQADVPIGQLVDGPTPETEPVTPDVG